MKRLVENLKKGEKKNVFSASQVFLGWLVRFGAGAAEKGEKDSASDKFCSSLYT